MQINQPITHSILRNSQVRKKQTTDKNQKQIANQTDNKKPIEDTKKGIQEFVQKKLNNEEQKQKQKVLSNNNRNQLNFTYNSNNGDKSNKDLGKNDNGKYHYMYGYNMRENQLVNANENEIKTEQQNKNRSVENYSIHPQRTSHINSRANSGVKGDSGREKQNKNHVYKERFVVCSSLPQNKPKYSFTFNNAPSISNIFNKNQNPPQANPQPNNSNKNQQTPNSSNLKFESSRKIRQQLDYCLYTLGDKIRQMKYQQEQLQASKPQQKIQIKQPSSQEQIKNQPSQNQRKLHSQRQSININPLQRKTQRQKLFQSQYHQKQKYRPSLTQLRKNNKLFLDRSIHRIEPQIIDQYIQTVYKEYDIPDILEQRSNQVISSMNNSIANQMNNNSFLYHNHNRTKTQNNPEDKNIKLRITQNNVKPLSSQPYLNQQGRLQNSFQDQRVTFNMTQNKKESNIDNQSDKNQKRFSIQNNPVKEEVRRNGRFQQNQKEKKRRKTTHKQFLNITLSKQKHIERKTFNSPSKNNKKEQQKQESRSRSISRNSQSRKKILDLKKNISNFKQNEHLLAQRYSYIQSPYQILRNRTQPIQKVNQPIDTQRQINIKVRPFQDLMRINVPVTQSTYQMGLDGTFINQHSNRNRKDEKSTTFNKLSYNLSTINKHNMTTLSQSIDTKFNKSFVTQGGQIVQQFRYCFLCQLPILSANIYKHEQKCIGWIHQQKLYTFKDLYQIQTQNQLIKLLKQRINQIRARIKKMVDTINQKQKNEQNYGNKVNKTIIQSVQNYIQQRFFNLQTENKQYHSNTLNANFKKIQQSQKNSYWNLVDQSYKLHWFSKMLENYEYKAKIMNKSVNLKNMKNQFQSTGQKNNMSNTFIQEESHNRQIASEFSPQTKMVRQN